MGVSGGPDMIQDGLVLALDAADRNSYPGTGTVWSDVGGNNSGTLVNSPTFNSANGGSIAFNGSTNYGRVQNFNSLNIQGPGTISYWGSFSDLGSVSVVRNSLSLTLGTPSTSALQIGTINAQGAVWKTGGAVLLSYNTPTINAITQWSLTFNNTALQMYINGVLTNSTNSAASLTGTSTDFYLASFSTAPDEPFAGTIYSVSAYNRVLSATEIAQNYNATKSRFGLI